MKEKNIRKIVKNHIAKEINTEPVYLYGAGSTAKICLQELIKANVNIKALIDDDVMKQGEKILSYEVMSYEKFLKNCNDKMHINVVLTSIYGKQIYNRLAELPNVIIWELYEWYMELLDRQETGIERHCVCGGGYS